MLIVEMPITLGMTKMSGCLLMVKYQINLPMLAVSQILTIMALIYKLSRITIPSPQINFSCQ